VELHERGWDRWGDRVVDRRPPEAEGDREAGLVPDVTIERGEEPPVRKFCPEGRMRADDASLFATYTKFEILFSYKISMGLLERRSPSSSCASLAAAIWRSEGTMASDRSASVMLVGAGGGAQFLPM
jgi:hypothetical protein